LRVPQDPAVPEPPALAVPVPPDLAVPVPPDLAVPVPPDLAVPVPPDLAVPVPPVWCRSPSCDGLLALQVIVMSRDRAKDSLGERKVGRLQKRAQPSNAAYDAARPCFKHVGRGASTNRTVCS
jgi:hypothetical protein